MSFNDIHTIISTTILAVLAYLYSKYQCRNYFNRIAVGISFLVLIILVFLRFDFNNIWLGFHIAALFFGLFVFKLSPLWFGVIVLFPFTGAMSFSNYSDQSTMFFCLLILMCFGYLMYDQSKHISFVKYIATLTSGLVLYFISSVISLPAHWLNGILAGIIALMVGAVFRYKKIGVIYFVLPAILAFYFSYFAAPDFDIKVRRTDLLAHDLGQFTFLSNDSIVLKQLQKSHLVLIETWHQYCTSCFRGMEDLHPFLTNLEYLYDFSHYYAYIGNDMTYDSVYFYPRIPSTDQRILVDPGQDYYKTLQMRGAPYFNFYQNGSYLFSISGYDARYSDRYKANLQKLIVKYSTSIK